MTRPIQSHTVEPDQAKPGPHSAHRGCRAKPRLTLASGGLHGLLPPRECWPWSFCPRRSIRGCVLSIDDKGRGLGGGSPVSKGTVSTDGRGTQGVDSTMSRNSEATWNNQSQKMGPPLTWPPVLQRGRLRTGRSTPHPPPCLEMVVEVCAGGPPAGRPPAPRHGGSGGGRPCRTARARLARMQVCLITSLVLPQVARAPGQSDRPSWAAAALSGYLGPQGSGSLPAGPQHQASHWPQACPLPTQALEVVGDCPQLKWPRGVSRPPAQWEGYKAVSAEGL